MLNNHLILIHALLLLVTQAGFFYTIYGRLFSKPEKKNKTRKRMLKYTFHSSLASILIIASYTLLSLDIVTN